MELGEEQWQGGASLNILEPEYAKLKSRNSVGSEYTISDLYISLCVLRNQSWVPVSVLSGMWQVDKEFVLAVVRLLSGLSLCTLSFREYTRVQAKEGGLMLHDLQLHFCKRQAEAMRTSSLFRRRILNGYMEPVLSTSGSSLLVERSDPLNDMLLECTPRPWWSVRDDGYVHAELARHLLSADLKMELAALLLDARWTYRRGEIGDMLAFKSDFECLMTLGHETLPHSVRQSFELIWKAIQVSRARLSEGQRSFLLQVYGRLFNLKTNNAFVGSYLESVETHTPKPYLQPVNSFFPDPRSAQVMEIPVGSYCMGVDCSPCGLFFAAGAGRDAVVADASTGDILKRLERHTDDVTCISFAAGSRKIVTGSRDNSVAVWGWEASEPLVHVLNGHSARVNGVAISSDGGKIISCSSDRTLLIWDANSGAQIGKFMQQKAVWSVAVSKEDQCVAVGLEGGALHVLDILTGDSIFEETDAHEDNLTSLAFSAHGHRLATGSLDATIQVWDTATWTSVGERFRGHTRSVNCVLFSPDEQQIASGSDDGTVRLWYTNTGSNTWKSSNWHNSVTSVAFTPEAERIISGAWDGALCVWDTQVEAEKMDREYGHSAQVDGVSISPNGLLVASGSSDGSIRLRNSRTGSQIGHPWPGHAAVYSVSFSPDGRQVAAGSDDGAVRLWDVETLNQIGDPMKGHRASVFRVAFSSDGLRIVSASEDKTVRIWDAISRMQIGDALLGHTAFVMTVSESGDGCHVLSRDYDDVVIIWNQDKRTIVWKSEKRPENSEQRTAGEDNAILTQELTDEEAEKTIRSCEQETRRLWPRSFPKYAAKMYSRDNSVFTNVPAEDTLLGTFPFYIYDWKYNEARKVFAAALGSGAVAICNLTD